jgi:hypothetical protein
VGFIGSIRIILHASFFISPKAKVIVYPFKSSVKALSTLHPSFHKKENVAASLRSLAGDSLLASSMH